MKTRFAISIVLCVSAVQPLAAQADVDRILEQLKASESKHLVIGDAHYSLVGPDLAGTRINKGALLRMATPMEHGWQVVVIAADGDPVMTGTYADQELTVANGLFIYYHVNDRVDCTGYYVQGTKTGIWTRYDTSGNVLAERIYPGRVPESVLVKQ